MVDGMRKRAQLPSPHVAGEKEHALALALGSGDVFEALEHNRAFYVLAGVMRQVREFRGRPTQIADQSAHYRLARWFRPVRKRKLQIEERDAAPNGPQPKQKRSQPSSHPTSRGPGQPAKKLESCPSRGVLAAFAHEIPLWARHATDARVAKKEFYPAQGFRK